MKKNECRQRLRWWDAFLHFFPHLYFYRECWLIMHLFRRSASHSNIMSGSFPIQPQSSENVVRQISAWNASELLMLKIFGLGALGLKNSSLVMWKKKKKKSKIQASRKKKKNSAKKPCLYSVSDRVSLASFGSLFYHTPFSVFYWVAPVEKLAIQSRSQGHIKQ